MAACGEGGRLVYGPRIKYTFTKVDGILIPLCYTYEYGETINPLGFAVWKERVYKKLFCPVGIVLYNFSEKNYF